ncbi:Importin N-terminal domain-containing protein [Plasmodiophora brassicae]|uniref:Importin N-terminal domain-containing protein n=1 Tax=Plasmodiophora brassicae TaxID=37360 RepID=A0A0G4IVZ8_PLABS|nr:hypothetical protein PBRA_001147 [Plasmodiophora brassicae]
MERLLDFNVPLDTGLLDQAVDEFFSGRSSPAVQEVLVKFQDHPDSWLRVDQILEKSQSNNTKIIALNILENAVKSRWKVLPAEHKEGIKKYIVDQIIKMSSNYDTLKAQSVFVRKLNLILVQVVKREWPQNWPSFIPDLVNSSKQSESLCANNMEILKLLSEEIFDYSKDEMTQADRKVVQVNLNAEFGLIFQLCQYVLSVSQDPALLSTTLSTLQRFLSWIPVGFIFETDLLELLAVKFLREPLFQNKALWCLADIGSLQGPELQQFAPKFYQLFNAVIQHVSVILPPNLNTVEIYAAGNAQTQAFFRHLANFLTGFLSSHLSMLENGPQDVVELIVPALRILLRISEIHESVIFKICLDFWFKFVSELYLSRNAGTPTDQSAMFMMGAGFNRPVAMNPKLQRYAPALSQLRIVLISRMAKPEEVLIVENEHGEIVKETLKDTDSIQLYMSMRHCLVYLTHLDPEDTQVIMLSKLNRQIDGSEWSWRNLNTLCWAIGSISGAMSEEMEKDFLVSVIKDLLGLCELKRGKEHKAVIASNIMYVVGQYPRFLRQHWRFLKTVVKKLFEFMHESYPGVQDMACDTFLKIAKRCRKKFVILQRSEMSPFIEEILQDLPEIIKDLQPSQIQCFYEAVGFVIGAETNAETRQRLVLSLMNMPNQSWTGIVAQANQRLESLWDPKTVASVKTILRTNAFVARSLGPGYMVQFGRIYLEMLNIYRAYSEFISAKVAQNPIEIHSSLVRGMRAVKSEILQLIQAFIESAQAADFDAIVANFLPPLLEPVLDDYSRAVPDARDATVLSLFATIIEKLGQKITEAVPRVLDSLFQPTIDMITTNFEDYPDHRIHFFSLLRAVNLTCFAAFFLISAEKFQMVMNSIAWSFKHLERNVADTGLNLLYELLQNVEKSEVVNDFYCAYMLSILQDVLAVLTDTFHKPGFKMHAQILAKLFGAVESGRITVPLWNAQGAGANQFSNNQQFIRHFVEDLLRKAFPQVTPAQISGFVQGLFQLHLDLTRFKEHLRDFLVQLKEFSADNADLFLEEQEQAKKAREEAMKAIPGMDYVPPSMRSGADEVRSFD